MVLLGFPFGICLQQPIQLFLWICCNIYLLIFLQFPNILNDPVRLCNIETYVYMNNIA